MTAVGVSFYEKLLKKNIALRNLIGGNIYTALGNENFFLRQKSLPLTIRKSFFEMKRKEFADGTHPAVATAAPVAKVVPVATVTSGEAVAS